MFALAVCAGVRGDAVAQVPAAGGTQPASSLSITEEEPALPAAEAVEEKTARPEGAGVKSRPLLRCNFYEEKSFLYSLERARPYELEGALAGGVVPHHLLAADYIASFFATAAQNADGYDTVLFLSTQHDRKNEDVVTASCGWSAPSGTVENDDRFTAALCADRALHAVVDNEQVGQDHAISGLIPYVAHYLPQARVAVCMVANGLSEPRCRALWETIDRLTADGRCLVVGSVDFSHYLSPEEAAERDRETEEAISSWNYEALSHMTDANLDSPETVIALMRYAQGIGVPLTRLDHASAEEILGQPPEHQLYADGITTYFIYAVVREGSGAH